MDRMGRHRMKRSVEVTGSGRFIEHETNIYVSLVSQNIQCGLKIRHRNFNDEVISFLVSRTVITFKKRIKGITLQACIKFFRYSFEPEASGVDTSATPTSIQTRQGVSAYELSLTSSAVAAKYIYMIYQNHISSSKV